jgi:oligoribonuclease
MLAPIAAQFLDKFCPTFMSHLHYRLVDVSTVKELGRRWYPDEFAAAPPKKGGHRAMADIVESLDEIRYYRAALFK